MLSGQREMSMGRLAGAIFAAACVLPGIAVAQQAEASKAAGNSTLLLGLQMRDGSSQEHFGILFKSAELIRRRLTIEGIRNARVVPVGEDRILISAAGTETLGKLKGPLTTIPKFSFRLLDNKGSAREALAGNTPADDELLWAVDDSGIDSRPLLVQRQEWLAGKNIEHADAGYNGVVGYSPVVNIRFDPDGADVLAQMTTSNSGRKLAIIWDNKIIAVYVITRPLLDGVIPVYAGLSGEAAQDLATVLNMATMVSPIAVIDEH